METQTKRIAILGGGPSGLFIYKHLAASQRSDLEIDIFEKNEQLGAGMPYSKDGAGKEHVTNVSENEIPMLVTSISQWLQTVPPSLLEQLGLEPESFHAYKVLPRLLFGQYLSAQFTLLENKAKDAGIITRLHHQCTIADITDLPQEQQVEVHIAGKGTTRFDHVIICTGHYWPLKQENSIPRYFDSPYPPAKLAMPFNHPIAIKGASLTAIDAVRTLALHNGCFLTDEKGNLSFRLATDSPDFKLMLHSLGGLLPAIRFHLQDPRLSHDSLLSVEMLEAHRKENDGFISLDFIFEKDFKEELRDREPAFYESVKEMTLEQFVAAMMEPRERREPFEMFRAEYSEAAQSIKMRESVYWKERLAILSFALNYPAKYLSAEDMLRLQQVLMPLISIVIAFVPQSSCQELIALYEAGVLSVVAVDTDSRVEPDIRGGATYYYKDEKGNPQTVHYQTFVNCVGQPHLSYEDFLFKSLLLNETISPARLKFKSALQGRQAKEEGSLQVEKDAQGDYYLRVAGIAINDNFQVVDASGMDNSRIFIMAVPFIGGYNPDYSGLDFCEDASARISSCLVAGCKEEDTQAMAILPS